MNQLLTTVTTLCLLFGFVSISFRCFGALSALLWLGKLTIALSADPKSANLGERDPSSFMSKRTLSPARKNSRLVPHVHSFRRDSFNFLLIN